MFLFAKLNEAIWCFMFYDTSLSCSIIYAYPAGQFIIDMTASKVILITLFQNGIPASFATRVRNINVFAAQMLSANAAELARSLHVLEGTKDSAITA